MNEWLARIAARPGLVFMWICVASSAALAVIGIVFAALLVSGYYS